jgi:hypothetical protein
MAAIRAGIAANLAPLTDPGVTVGDSLVPIQILEYHIDDPSPPSIMVEALDEIDYKVAFGGQDGDLQVIVQAITGTVTDKGAQVLLDTMLLGATAVKKLLEVEDGTDGAVTFGGTVSDAFVSHCSGHKLIPFPGKRVLGAEWTVIVTLTD